MQTADPFGQETTLEPRKVVMVKGTANWDSAFDTLVDAFKALNTLLDKQGIKHAGNSMIVYTSTDDTGFTFLAEIPVDQDPQKLPKDMSVTITKEGEQPAKIVVKQGDKTWETTEDKLDDLPDEVRGHVQSFLGRSPFSIAIEGAQPNFGAAPFPNAAPGMRRRDDDARFKDIQKQLEGLQQAIEALEKKLQAPR